MNGKTASPMDHMGIKKLRGYKIDRVLKNNGDHNWHREHNDRYSGQAKAFSGFCDSFALARSG